MFYKPYTLRDTAPATQVPAGAVKRAIACLSVVFVAAADGVVSDDSECLPYVVTSCFGRDKY